MLFSISIINPRESDNALFRLRISKAHGVFPRTVPFAVRASGQQLVDRDSVELHSGKPWNDVPHLDSHNIL